MRHPIALPAAFVRRFLTTLTLAALAFASLPAPRLTAKNADWQDMSGAKFRGEPIEVLGPFALFKTSLTTGRRVLLRGLSPDDTLRLYREISKRPLRAEHWSEAKGAATSDLLGNVLSVKNKTLVPADLTALPEPELLIVLFGSHNDGESWFMLRTFTAVFERIQRVYPGKVGCVFMGVRHNRTEHRRIAIDSYMPWLVSNFESQPSMSLLSRYAPEEGAQMLVLSRDGVPLVGARATDLTAIKKFADDLSVLLAALDSSNPRSWKDRQHYLALARPLDFATDKTGPLLIGDPLRPEGLRQRDVARVEARLDIADDGTVSQVTLLPGSIVPDPLKAPLSDALRKQTLFVPAIDHGNAVPGTYDYTFVVPPENKSLAADTSWLNGDARHDLPLSSWLILGPINVEEKDFSEIDHVADDDTVMMKPLQVSTARVSRASQMNAFNTDWFTDAGADSVRPAAGHSQNIDGATFTWKRVSSSDGLVDFGEHEYSVAYAWTEFESPADTDAWLGLGSDDGVKIWLNGQLVNDRWIRRMSRLDDDVVPLRLKKGPNRLLIKIQNATGDASFIARLRTR